MSGQVMINSSLLSIPRGYDLKVQNISLLDLKYGNFPKESQTNDQLQLYNASIGDLRLYGTFKVRLNQQPYIFSIII